MKNDNKVAEQVLELMRNTPKERWESPYLFPSPMNYKSKKAYRGVNALLLGFRCIQDSTLSPYFLTFRQIKEAGGSVKAGSKGHQIEFWKPFIVERKKEKAEDELEGMQPEEEEAEEPKRRRQYLMHRYYYVFNARDITGINFKTPERREVEQAEQDMYNSLCRQCEARGLTVTHAERNIAYFNRISNTINIPPLEWLRKADSITTLIHEMIHSTMLDFNRTLDYATEELVAEIGAMLAAMRLGIRYKMDANNIQYVKGWVSHIGNDEEQSKAIAKACSMAQKAVDLLFPEPKEAVI